MIAIAIGLLLCTPGSGLSKAPGTHRYAIETMTIDAASKLYAQQSSVAVLYTPQFKRLSSNQVILAVAASPAPKKPPQVSWTSSSANLKVQRVILTGEGNARLTASVLVQQMETGVSTVVAHLGPPIFSSVTFSVFAYDSLDFGCDFRSSPAAAFGSEAPQSQVAESPANSDIFQTLGSDVADPASANNCARTPAFLGPPSSGLVTHVPYGGVVVPGGLNDFPFVEASQWRNAATSFDPYTNGILIFKTHSGAVVKFMPSIGPYQVTDSTGRFPY